MEPAELFEICIFRWFRKLAQLTGLDFFVKNYKPNVVTYGNMSTLWLFLVSCLWTIYSYEFDGKIISCAVLAFNCQVRPFYIMDKHCKHSHHSPNSRE